MRRADRVLTCFGNGTRLFAVAAYAGAFAADGATAPQGTTATAAAAVAFAYAAFEEAESVVLDAILSRQGANELVAAC